MTAHARDLKGARYALWRNPEDLTGRQKAKLAWVAKVNRRLYRAYLLKEQLRLILHVKNADAIGMLQKWIAWARRSRIPAFVELARRVHKNMKGILQALLNNLSNGLIESTNTKLRLLTRIAYGIKDPDHLIALLPRPRRPPATPPRPMNHQNDSPHPRISEESQKMASGAGLDSDAVLATYNRWLLRQPLAARSRDAYLAQVHGSVIELGLPIRTSSTTSDSVSP